MCFKYLGKKYPRVRDSNSRLEITRAPEIRHWIMLVKCATVASRLNKRQRTGIILRQRMYMYIVIYPPATHCRCTSWSTPENRSRECTKPVFNITLPNFNLFQVLKNAVTPLYLNYSHIRKNRIGEGEGGGVVPRVGWPYTLLFVVFESHHFDNVRSKRKWETAFRALTPGCGINHKDG